ncbi:MAG: CHC2 zinc finger domain-containing protein [Terracidiphilus sp.]
MQAEEFARLLHARRIGKNRWLGLCPVHGDRHPSLSIGIGKKSPIVFKCQSAGCAPGDILKAMGLRWSDLLGEASKEVRAMMGERERLELLEKQLSLVIWLGLLEPKKRNYWKAAYRRIEAEWKPLWCKLNPDECQQKVKEKLFQRELKRVGWTAMMEGVPYGR